MNKCRGIFVSLFSIIFCQYAFNVFYSFSIIYFYNNMCCFEKEYLYWSELKKIYIREFTISIFLIVKSVLFNTQVEDPALFTCFHIFVKVKSNFCLKIMKFIFVSLGHYLLRSQCPNTSVSLFMVLLLFSFFFQFSKWLLPIWAMMLIFKPETFGTKNNNSIEQENHDEPPIIRNSLIAVRSPF